MDKATVKALHPDLDDAAIGKVIDAVKAIDAVKTVFESAPAGLGRDSVLRRIDGLKGLAPLVFKTR